MQRTPNNISAEHQEVDTKGNFLFVCLVLFTKKKKSKLALKLPRASVSPCRLQFGSSLPAPCCSILLKHPLISNSVRKPSIRHEVSTLEGNPC